MPSLVPETLGRVATEAMSNGIPVLAGGRGALPETVGDAEAVLPLPVRLTPGERLLPTAEEVRPWVVAIIRLWDDAGHYEDLGRRARGRSELWGAEALGPQYERFLEGLRPGTRPTGAAAGV